MRAPDLSIDDVKNIVNTMEFTTIEEIGKGGQKAVFKVSTEDNIFTLKFLEIQEERGPLLLPVEEDLTQELETEVLARAKREIAIMEKCDSPNLVKLGPVPISFTEYQNKRLIFFSEEYIDGNNLYEILSNRGIFSIQEALNLASDITIAINELWSINMVHRDIKLPNIMRRNTGDYILLDAGIAFDTLGTVLTKTFGNVGTDYFKSPEQIKGIKSTLDFRSDLFLLGLVLYVVLTLKHPFADNKTTGDECNYNIFFIKPKEPKQFNQDIPDELNRLILRLLGKEPHLRFKSCEELLAKIAEIKERY
jgi:eukaryotic-like serine/threonine-protein kinase